MRSHCASPRGWCGSAATSGWQSPDSVAAAAGPLGAPTHHLPSSRCFPAARPSEVEEVADGEEDAAVVETAQVQIGLRYGTERGGGALLAFHAQRLARALRSSHRLPF